MYRSFIALLCAVYEETLKPMQQRTINALLLAYRQLQRIAEQLYNEAQTAIDYEQFLDATLLISQAEKVFELAENLDVVISEQEE